MRKPKYKAIFAVMVAWRCPEPVEVVELLRGRMGESMRQVEGLFEALLSESFGEK